MKSDTKSKKLLQEFPVHTYEEWRAAAVELLKGKDFDKTLITKTYEGFDLQPIYRREDIANLPHLKQMPGTGNYVRGSKESGYLKQAWEISQEIIASTPEEFNAIALSELERGQSEINLVLDGSTRRGKDPSEDSTGSCCKGGCPCVGVSGLSLATLTDWETAFKGIHLDAVSLYIHAGASGLQLAGFWLALAKKQSVDSKKLRGCIENDPLGFLAMRGKYPVALEKAYDDMALLTKSLSGKAPQIQTLCANGMAYSNGGASAVQELAFVLATAIEYIREMQKRGLGIEAIESRIRLSFGIGPKYFTEVAKFRAARLLWAEIIKAFGGKASPYLFARTALWNKTQIDPYVNMLRTTTEAFSAAIGGVDAMHIGPFDEVVRRPDEFSRRIARNTHFILAEECDLNKVVDPAGGSFYIESLTDQIAGKAWALVQKIEAAGGMAAALKAGIPQAEVAAVADKKRAAISSRRDVIVGTNQYPNPVEKALEARSMDKETIRAKRAADVKKVAKAACDKCVSPDLDKLVEAATNGITLGGMTGILQKDATVTEIAAVPFRRASEDYEQLRKAIDASGKDAVLFQANMGPSRKYRLRADWTSGFYQVGGFKVLNDKDFKDADEAVAAYKASGAKIAIITSDDESYVTVVEPTAKALKAAGAYVLVAGAPGETEAAWRAAGVDDFVNVRVNNYQMLNNLLKKLGVLA